MTELQSNTKKLLSFISEKFISEKLDNNSLVQIIELCGGFLNLQTISEYARQNKLSYNGAKKFRKVIDVFGVKMILDNQ